MSASTTGTSFGGRLREAREQRGISLRQIATSTKISVVALEALERNDIPRLPGGIFSRAFVRSYAHEIGLDPEATVRDFLAAFPEDTVTIGSPQAAQEHKDAEESAFESRQRVAWTLFKLVLVSLPLGALLLYFSTRGGAGHTTASGPRAPVSAIRGPAVRESPPTEPAAVPAMTGAPSSAQAEPIASPATSSAESAAAPGATGAASASAAAPEGSGLRLEVAPTGACWVSLTVDGNLVLARVMQPGERVARRIQREAVVQIGDAGAFAFSLNGRAGRSVGEPGQVRTLRITPEDIETLVR